MLRGSVNNVSMFSFLESFFTMSIYILNLNFLCEFRGSLALFFVGLNFSPFLFYYFIFLFFPAFGLFSIAVESRSRQDDKGPQRGDLPKIRFESTPRPVIPATESNFLSQEFLLPGSRYSQYCNAGQSITLSTGSICLPVKCVSNRVVLYFTQLASSVESLILGQCHVICQSSCPNYCLFIEGLL